MNATDKTIVNANLFSRLFDGVDDFDRLAIETIDGQHISYGALVARAGQMANVLVNSGVKPGDRVAAGQPVMTLEAMKMQHVHAAGIAGTVAAIDVAEGEQVAMGKIVVEIEAAA